MAKYDGVRFLFNLGLPLEQIELKLSWHQGPQNVFRHRSMEEERVSPLLVAARSALWPTGWSNAIGVVCNPGSWAFRRPGLKKESLSINLRSSHLE